MNTLILLMSTTTAAFICFILTIISVALVGAMVLRGPHWRAHASLRRPRPSLWSLRRVRGDLEV